MRFCIVLLAAMQAISALADDPERPFAAAEERIYSALGDMVLASQAVHDRSSLFMEGYLRTAQGLRPRWRLHVKHPALEYHAECWWQRSQKTQMGTKPPGFEALPLEGQLALQQWATEARRVWTELARDREGWRSRMLIVGSPAPWKRPTDEQPAVEFVRSVPNPAWLRPFDSIIRAQEISRPVETLRAWTPLDWFKRLELTAAEPGLRGQLITTWRSDISSTQSGQNEKGETVEVTTRTVSDVRVVFDPAYGDMPVEVHWQPIKPDWYLADSRAVIKWQKIGEDWLPARVKFVNTVDLYGPENSASDRSSTAEYLYHWLLGDDVPAAFYDSEQETRSVMLTHYERAHGDSTERRFVEISPTGLAREANRKLLGPMAIPDELAKSLEAAK